MKVTALAFVAALCASCAAPQTDGGKEDGEATYRSLPAPTPDGVDIVIKAARDGETIAVKVGQMIAVELIGVPTAGYMWTIAEAPPFLAPAGEYGGPTSSAQLEPGFAGGNHWEAFVFNVTGAGEGILRLEQRRAWEDDEPPADEFSVNIVATE